MFREIKDGDLESVATILAKAGNMLWTPDTTRETVWEYLLHGGHTGYVIEHIKGVIGVSFVETFDNPFLQHSATCQFAVHPDHQGLGWGLQLVASTLKCPALQDKSRISLHVTIDNIRAIKLYLKCGFEFESRERCGYLGKDQYIMSIIRT